MKIYFVRHGHPDYVNDCLTELGNKQAEAAARRLKNSGIKRIFSSSCGRALQTAQYTADALGIDITLCDFMREMEWGSVDEKPILLYGDPWKVADTYVSNGQALDDGDWRKKEPYCRSKILACEKTVVNGLDAWLCELGYQREGEYYRVVGEKTDTTVAMFSHGGSSSMALSHLLNIPFPQMCGLVHPDFTSITVAELSDKKGELCYPRIIVLNDFAHIEALSS